MTEPSGADSAYLSPAESSRIAKLAVQARERKRNKLTSSMFYIGCNGCFSGGPGVSRTRDLEFRKLLLYPSELRGHCCNDTYVPSRAVYFSGQLRTEPQKTLANIALPMFRESRLYPSELQGQREVAVAGSGA